MSLPKAPRAALAFVAGIALLASGCSSIRDHQGYLIDETLIAGVQPGVDNRDSVAASLGRPTFVGQFDQRDWYYVSRDTRQMAFNMPRPSRQTVLHVRFDEAGNVVSVNRSGLELVTRIDPSDEATPTLGRERSLFEELFGNIGALGQGRQTAQTPDNPQ